MPLYNPAIQSISAGTTLLSSGQAIFSNLNGVSFGINGQTVTGSVAAGATATGNIGAIAAGTQTATSGTIQFVDGNGVTFGMDGSATITASAGGLSNIRVSAGTTSNLLSAITFADGSNVSFGINASTLTASVATSLTAIRVSAGTTSNLLSAITFANGNNVSFGINASTVTASVVAAAPTVNMFDNLNQIGGTAVLMNSIGTFDGSMFVAPLNPPWQLFPGNMTASTVLLDMSGNPGGTQTNSHTFTVQLGIYTVNGSTLSILNSVSTTMGAGADNATNTQLYQGARYLSFHSSQWSAQPTFSRTQYLLALNILSTNQAVDLSWLGQRYFMNVQRSGTMGSAQTTGSTSNGWNPYIGIYSATTGAFPASIHISELDKFNFASGANFAPHVQFQNLLTAF